MATIVTKARKGRSTGVEGVEAVEIKVTVRPDQELRALRAFKVDEDTAEVRVIYFYDTRRLTLFTAGVVLRARLVKGETDDTTVKMRPVKLEDVASEWKKLSGFKVEADRTGERVVCSASLTRRRKRAEIEAVAQRDKSVEQIFSTDQIRFLEAFYKRRVDFSKLDAMGPIRVLCWSVVHKDFRHKMTCEEWRLPDGEDLVEVSIKVKPSEAAVAQRDFMTHLRELGLDPNGDQQTKTRTALKYFATHPRESGAGKSSATGKKADSKERNATKKIKKSSK